MKNDSEKFTNFPEDLHIFISDFNQFVQPLKKIFSQRTKNSKEFWMVYGSNVRTVIDQLNNFKNIDLDDDLYIYEEENSEEKTVVQMWEVYRIHHTIPVQVLHYGNWSDEKGMNLENQFKWKRRRNLQV